MVNIIANTKPVSQLFCHKALKTWFWVVIKGICFSGMFYKAASEKCRWDISFYKICFSSNFIIFLEEERKKKDSSIHLLVNSLNTHVGWGSSRIKARRQKFSPAFPYQWQKSNYVSLPGYTLAGNRSESRAQIQSLP